MSPRLFLSCYLLSVSNMILSVLSLPFLFFALNASSPAFRENVTPVVLDTTDRLVNTPLYRDYLAPGFSSTLTFVNDTFTKWTTAAPPRPSPVPPTSMSPYQLQRALWNAASNGNATRVEELLLVGADPTLPFQGIVLLELVAKNSLYNRFYDLIGVPNPWVSVIEVLLLNGADPAQRDEEGRTPYEHYEQFVVWYPNPDIKRLLNPPPRRYDTLQRLLRFAVCSGDAARVALRLQQGADPTALSYERSFLELAAHNSHKYEGDWAQIIRILLQHGADPNQLDGKGLTAREHYARLSHPKQEIAELLGA